MSVQQTNKSKLEALSIWKHFLTTSSPSNPLEFVLANGNAKLDLRKKEDRKNAVTEILSCASNAKINEETGTFGDQIHSKYARDAVLYALMVNDSQFEYTLSLINTKLIQMKVQHLNTSTLTINFIKLIIYFGNCPAILKYMFRKKTNLWKPYLLSIINALISISDHQERERESFTLIMFLERSIYYWKKQHFVFIINNDVCKLLKQTITTTWKKHKNQIYSYYSCPKDDMRKRIYGDSMYSMFSFFCAMIVCYAKKLDKKNGNQYILRYFQQKMRAEFGGFMRDEYECKRLFFRDNFEHMSSQHRHETIYKVLKVDVAACQWFRCFKFRRFDMNNLASDEGPSLDKPRKLYKCKGCRLIFYCCRNHQKKDWKYLHSQQCLKIYQ